MKERAGTRWLRAGLPVAIIGHMMPGMARRQDARLQEKRLSGLRFMTGRYDWYLSFQGRSTQEWAH